MVLICISLIAPDVECLFICLFAIYIFFDEVHGRFAPFTINLFVFLLLSFKSFCVFWVKILYQMCLLQIFFSKSVACFIITLTLSFTEQSRIFLIYWYLGWRKNCSMMWPLPEHCRTCCPIQGRTDIASLSPLETICPLPCAPQCWLVLVPRTGCPTPGKLDMLFPLLWGRSHRGTPNSSCPVLYTP